jgi:hypothetical protein
VRDFSFTKDFLISSYIEYFFAKRFNNFDEESKLIDQKNKNTEKNKLISENI